MASISPETVQAMVAWRHDLHAHPETAFTEFRTSDLVARELSALGLEVHRGLAKTGVVASIRNGDGPVIGLRADMDALLVEEQGTVPHASLHPGKMHACGHDGHTAMLLGAARHLAAHRDFRGTVRFIFQPAEENECGGRVMIEEGLFERFPCDQVYAMHNWPGLPAGHFSVNHGPMMASFDMFEIVVQGRSTHAAMPERGVDPFPAAAQIVLGLQTIVSRRLSANDSAVVSVTQVHGGETWNTIPETVTIRGGVRTFSSQVQDLVEQAIHEISEAIAHAHGASATVAYRRRYPATINTPAEADIAIAVARSLVGTSKVSVDVPPSMASEDFAYFLRSRPGAYVWIGVDSDRPSVPLHNACYDFNDEILGLGAAYFVNLVKQILSPPTLQVGEATVAAAHAVN